MGRAHLAPELFETIEWRCIGPHRGGRVVAVAGDPPQAQTFYFGACAGGVWKTTDGGTYWENVSDGYFGTAAVGAIAIADAELASQAFGADFEAVRAYGDQGDFKCDGRRVSTGTIFQCYAPDRMDQARLNAKIDEDFRGAHMHWGSTVAEWILVHNDGRGLPPQTAQLLNELQKIHPETKIQVWTEAQRKWDLLGVA